MRLNEIKLHPLTAYAYISNEYGNPNSLLM